VSGLQIKRKRKRKGRGCETKVFRGEAVFVGTSLCEHTGTKLLRPGQLFEFTVCLLGELSGGDDDQRPEARFLGTLFNKNANKQGITFRSIAQGRTKRSLSTLR